jgi:hypothetical protein
MGIHTPKAALHSSTILSPVTAATAKAILAYDLSVLLGISMREACIRCNASPPYAYGFARLCGDCQDAVRRGALRLAHVVNGRKPTSARVDRFIADAGIDEIWAGLDRATRPVPEPAAVVNGNGHGADLPFTETFFGEAEA